MFLCVCMGAGTVGRLGAGAEVGLTAHSVDLVRVGRWQWADFNHSEATFLAPLDLETFFSASGDALRARSAGGERAGD